VGYHSSVLIVIFVFGVLFSALYVSSQLAIPRHSPNIISTEPKISQLQVIETVEQHLRSRIPDLETLRLYFFLYNYTNDRNSDAPVGGWSFSSVKQNPELLNLPLFFVHANGTQYQINSTDGSYQVRCLKAPDINNCAFPKSTEYAVKDRLVYRTESIWYPPANISSSYYSPIEGYHIVDAETGELVWNSIDYYKDKLPAPPNLDYEGQKTIKQRLSERLNPPAVTQIDIEEGAASAVFPEQQQQKFFVPEIVRAVDTLSNRVVWTNKDTVAHTVRSDDGYSNPYTGKFSSDLIQPNEKYEYTFIEIGEYPYHCDLHPWMKGSVKVVENFV
jgi:plastocyanin